MIVTTALAMLMLLGFMAVALDFGHLFVVKDELQTSMDACALAAAQELDCDRNPCDSISRARNAGMAAGNLNNVNFQSGTWSGKGKIDGTTDIKFRDATYTYTNTDKDARYAQCQHTQPGIVMWLFRALGAAVGSTDPAYSSTRSVGALAVATLAPSQTSCPLPLAVVPKAGGSNLNNYGFQIGEWITVWGNRIPNSGEMGWYNLDGSANANETAFELGEPGYCGVKVGDVLGTPGAKTSVDVIWNYRFGLYKNGDPGPSTNHPDRAGYAYVCDKDNGQGQITKGNWRKKNPPHCAQPLNAYDGTLEPGSGGSDPAAANFITMRSMYASYDNTGTSINHADNDRYNRILNMTGGYKNLATPGTGGHHQLYGYNRRLAVIPVLNGSNAITDFVCVLLLQPMSGPNADVEVEYRGLAGAPGSPCTSNGFPGSAAGTGAAGRVPALVQ